MERLKPKLRFPEFEGNWKMQQLGDVGDIKMCRRIFNEETTTTGDIPFFKIGSFGKVADAFISKELYLNYRSRFSFPKKGDILISAAGTIGRTVVYNGEDAYFQDSNIVWIDNDNTITSNEFLFYIYQIVSFNTEGGTIQRLYNNILKSTKFFNPSIEEQTKIANFLSSVDEKLNLLKEKKAHLEDYKKGIMQKIFNQEIRFKDDNGNDFEDWQEILISELTKIIVGGTPSTTKEEYWNGDIAWLSSGELNNGLVKKARKHITAIGLKNSSAKIMKPHTVMLAMTGATLGKIGYLTFESTGNQSIAGFEPNNKYVSKFFYYNILFNKNLILSMAGGAAQQGINKASIESLFFTFPNLQEQSKIANFLSAIDEKIELVSNQIQDTQDYKKGLLQQMFV
jgi:type I restriction enzyme S subunit